MEEFIEKHLGINTPQWIIENCKVLLIEWDSQKADTSERQLTIPDVRLALSGFWAWYAELSIEELEWYSGKEVETYLATL